MIIGERIRAIRESLNLSQGDIQERTGLLRCYISRVEGGHAVPSLETIEKLAQAFVMPLYRFFCYEEGSTSPAATELRSASALHSTTDADVRQFSRLLAKMTERDRHLLLSVASLIARRRKESRA